MSPTRTAEPSEVPARVRLGTKAETLARLGPLLTRAYVMAQVAFPVEAWRSDRRTLLARIQAKLQVPRLIVRSSARSEDTTEASAAGAYASVLDVPASDDTTVAAAVDRVIASYGGAAGDHQVLVQEQLEDVRLAGVLFTRDPGTLGPYFVFNYDDRTRSTESVTSGRGADLRTYVRFRGTGLPFPGEALAAVVEAAREVEALVGNDRLDIELAVDGGGRVCIFQVRPIVTSASPPPAEAEVADWLAKVRKKVEKLGRRHPHLHGDRTAYGVMPDWNPAEMIGLKPRPLALSLYKEIITDAIWAYQREGYGYKNLRSFPLLVSFLGVPFIDVRVDFNSFLPAGLRDDLAEKLANHYVSRLVACPHLHDKIEFDIAFSCYYPGIREAIRRLEDDGFTGPEVGEILGELRILTNRIIHPSTGLYRVDLAKFEDLKDRRRRILTSGMPTIDKIYWLIEDGKRYGTLPFSGLARAAFIAVQFLKGFVALGILSPEDYEAFLGSLNTVAQRMAADLTAVARGALSWASFLEHYGHLRPGTYDILSPRYDEAAERYFGTLAAAEIPPRPPPFRFTAAQTRAIAAYLRREGIDIGPEALLDFCRTVIEGREYGKLVFTRSLSDALALIEALGRSCGLEREDCSYLDIRTVLRLYASLDALDLRDTLQRDIEANRRAWAMTRVVRLPHLIVHPDDVLHFHLGEDEPNYIGTGRVVADVARAEGGLDHASLSGRIVCIPSADPGYDWIFSKGIAGLITLFGGANSHMAIRAGELGIPAVIGCGPQNYEPWSGASCLEIDCANRRVAIIR